MPRPIITWVVSAPLLLACVTTSEPAAAAVRGTIEFSVIDEETGEPTHARMELTNERGVSIRSPGAVSFGNFFVIPGRLTLRLPPGAYTYRLSHGPEYQARRGRFVLAERDNLQQVEKLPRIANLRDEGWYGGDLLVSHPPKQLAVMQEAEDLQFAWSAVGPSEDDSESPPHSAPAAVRWARSSGDLAVIGSPPPPPEPQPSIEQLVALRGPDQVVIGLRPSAWDMPAWLAHDSLDALALLRGNVRAEIVIDDESDSVPRDRTLYPTPRDQCRWSETIYWRALNQGYRITPVACSESGWSPNPVGFHRVYVECPGEPDAATWLQRLAAGHVFVTNGPLLRARFNDQSPGHVFRAEAGETVTITTTAQLATRDKIRYLAMIKDGESVHETRLESLVENRGELPSITFQKSGWMLLRVVTEEPQSYGTAFTGPIYVTIGDSPPLDPPGARFFRTINRRHAIKLRDTEPDTWGRSANFYKNVDSFWKRRDAN